MLAQRRSHLRFNGQLRQQRNDLRFIQRTRMLHTMNVNEPFDPAYLGGFGAVRRVFAPERVADLLEEFRRM